MGEGRQLKKVKIGEERRREKRKRVEVEREEKRREEKTREKRKRRGERRRQIRREKGTYLICLIQKQNLTFDSRCNIGAWCVIYCYAFFT